MKKILLCLIGILTLFGTAVYAAEITADFSKEKSALTVTADFGEENAYTRAVAVIMKGQNTLPSVEDSEYEEELQKMTGDAVAQMTGITDENGICVFEPITINEFSGESTIYVGIYGGSGLSSKQQFLSGKADVSEFVNNINNCSTSSAIRSILDSECVSPKFGADMSWYSQLSESGKNKVAEALLAYKTAGRYDESNEKRIQNADDDIVTASVIVYACEKKDYTLVKELLNIEESSFSDKYKSIIKTALDLDSFRLLQSGKDTYKADDAVYQSIAEIDFFNAKQFKEAATVGIINYKLKRITVWTDVDEILEAYQTELSSLDYTKLSAKSDVKDAMTAIYNGVPYTGIEDLIARINTILAKNYTTSTGGSSGGGGGGGGGGGSLKDFSISVDVSESNDDNGNTQTSDRMFADVPYSHWGCSAIEALAQKGIVSGTGNNLFEPDRNITREEFVQMICVAFGLKDSSAKCEFDDVADGAWYEAVVACANEKGIVNGITDNIFGVGMNITRQDMAVMAYRVLIYSNPDLSAEEPKECDFSDSDTISEYANQAVSFMYKENIISGMGNGVFAPKANATRAQAAKIIYGLLNYTINN